MKLIAIIIASTVAAKAKVRNVPLVGFAIFVVKFSLFP